MHGAEQLSAVPSIKLLAENWLGEMPWYDIFSLKSDLLSN